MVSIAGRAVAGASNTATRVIEVVCVINTNIWKGGFRNDDG